MKTKRGVLLLTATVTVLMLTVMISACTTPCPLYGKWQSSTGDKLTLSTDGSFSAKITINGTAIDYRGTWKQNKNVLEFQSNSIAFNSLWTIDGSLLKITWPSNTNGNTINLEMYREAAE